MKMLVRLCRLHDGLTDAGFLLSTLGLFLMVTIYCAEVVARYFFGQPLYWANDAFANILCVSVFAMVPHATRATAHIEINVVPELFPGSRPALAAFSALAGTLICGFVAWMSSSENLRQYAMGILSEQNNPVPVWWLTSFITYAFAGASLYFLRTLFRADALRPVSFVRPGDVTGHTASSV